jgi:Ni/Co efflux regulator RcnB
MRTIFIAALVALPMAATAADESAEFGKDTRAWLDLQRSGHAAWGHPRPLSGEAADRVYERYLRSFTHPIPEAFERGGFVRGGGSGR